jgi:poly-gamma-glutamate synthesis protein (capsule biosynthesis protein)
MASGLIDDLAIDAVRRDVANARRNADVVIIYEHWGEERVGTPSPEQARLARAAIDAGASVVVGAHPHVLGPIARYHRGIIAYSLGNFVFDAFHGAGTRSAILEVSFEGARIASWHVAPVEIYGGVPYPLSPESPDAKLIESAIASRPGPIEGTAVPRHIGKRSGRPGGSRLQPIPL